MARPLRGGGGVKAGPLTSVLRGGVDSIHIFFLIIFTAQTRGDQALRHPSKFRNLAIFYHAKNFSNKFTFSVVFTTLKIRIKTPNSEVRLRALNIEGANSLILSCSILSFNVTDSSKQSL